MKTTLLRCLPAILVALAMQSCEEPGNSPLSDCVTASIEYRNSIEGTFYQQSSFSDDNFDAYNSLPRSITVPSGSIIRINSVWNLREYEVDNAEIDKIFVNVTQGQVEKSCELILTANNSIPQFELPAYQSMTINVRFVLKSGAEQLVGPFNVTVQNDNKIITHLTATGFGTGTTMLTSNIASEQSGLHYLWSPNYVVGNIAFVSHRAPLTSSLDLTTNNTTSTGFGVFCLTTTGLPSNQIKLVASDKIAALNLYPELVQPYGCFLGNNYARFEPINLSLDTTNLQSSFENATNNMTYANLDTLSFNNPVSELVLSKAQPAFKILTSSGKKGYAVVTFSNIGSANVFFRMQR